MLNLFFRYELNYRLDHPSIALKKINRNLLIKFFTNCVAFHKKCIFAAQSTTIKKYGIQN